MGNIGTSKIKQVKNSQKTCFTLKTISTVHVRNPFAKIRIQIRKEKIMRPNFSHQTKIVGMRHLISFYHKNI